ncbi:hypothetical protein MBLNU459_g6712t1 [Dothideomycetes sp. NU459]
MVHVILILLAFLIAMSINPAAIPTICRTILLTLLQSLLAQIVKHVAPAGLTLPRLLRSGVSSIGTHAAALLRDARGNQNLPRELDGIPVIGAAAKVLRDVQQTGSILYNILTMLVDNITAFEEFVAAIYDETVARVLVVLIYAYLAWVSYLAFRTILRLIRAALWIVAYLLRLVRYSLTLIVRLMTIPRLR